MKRIVRLNERELHSLISESVHRILKESYGGWEQDPMEWPMANTSSDGNKLFKVGLWWGSGYVLDNYLAWANHEEEALNYVVAYISENNPEILENSDECAEQALRDIMEENNCSEDEAEMSPEFEESFLYIDATMEGADAPHYIWEENLTVIEAPEEWKQKFLEREQSNQAQMY